NRQLDKIRSDFAFLRARAVDGRPFDRADLMAASQRNATEASARTYFSKHYGQFVVPAEGGKYTVQKDFLNVRLREFASLFSQAETLYTDYDRFVHKTVQVFEFYLPLTHERRLRETLDRLFYADTVRQRLEEIGAERLSKHVSRKRGEDDHAYY